MKCPNGLTRNPGKCPTLSLNECIKTSLELWSHQVHMNCSFSCDRWRFTILLCSVWERLTLHGDGGSQSFTQDDKGSQSFFTQSDRDSQSRFKQVDGDSQSYLKRVMEAHNPTLHRVMEAHNPASHRVMETQNPSLHRVVETHNSTSHMVIENESWNPLCRPGYPSTHNIHLPLPFGC